MTRMIRTLRKIAANPLVRRLAIWLAPVIIGWVMDKLTNSKKRTTASSTTKKKK